MVRLLLLRVIVTVAAFLVRVVLKGSGAKAECVVADKELHELGECLAVADVAVDMLDAAASARRLLAVWSDERRGEGEGEGSDSAGSFTAMATL